MTAVSVKTREELKKVIEKKVDMIVVEGELAAKLKKAKKILKLSKIGLTVLTASLGTAAVSSPFTGGLSFAVAAPVAALTGIEIATIITASCLGISLVISVFKGYEEISFEEGKLVLKKNKNCA